MLKELFNSYSRRKRVARKSKECTEVTPTFRNRLAQWCAKELFSDPHYGDRSGFWYALHSRLCMLYGLTRLSSNPHCNETEDLGAFWGECASDQFLDIVESICFLSIEHRSSVYGNDIVQTINHLFSVDDLPFRLTSFTFEEQSSATIVGKFEFPPALLGGKVTTVAQYPKAILREDEVAHSEILEPALDLLADAAFKTANAEYREALTHYRMGQYNDALTKCGSSLESVMKIICVKKRWAHSPNDTAGPLVKIMMREMKLDSYFDALLMIVATLRNKLSSAHGAGVKTRAPSRHLARYAINATASAILLLAGEANLA